MSKESYTSEDFTHFVNGLIAEWELALELKRKWAKLDGEERALYTEDWPVNNDIHQHLADYVAEHELTEPQKVQWDRLNELVAKHTRALERMGYRVRPPEGGKGRAVA